MSTTIKPVWCANCGHRRDEHCLTAGICKHDYPGGEGCVAECLKFEESARMSTETT